MGINVEMTWNNSVTLEELEQFVAQAKVGGASAETIIEPVTADTDSTIQLGWRVSADGRPVSTTSVALPHRLMWQIQSMLEQIASGDGDVRGSLGEIREYADELREALVKHATR